MTGKPPPDPRVEAARLLQVEVATIAGSLLVPVDESGPGPRRWRPLASSETAEVYDRMVAAVTRYAKADPRQ